MAFGPAVPIHILLHRMCQQHPCWWPCFLGPAGQLRGHCREPHVDGHDRPRTRGRPPYREAADSAPWEGSGFFFIYMFTLSLYTAIRRPRSNAAWLESACDRAPGNPSRLAGALAFYITCPF